MITGNVGPSWPRSDWDDLEVAPGRKIGDVDTPTLTALIEKLNVPGFLHANGRQANIEAFSYARQKVYDQAGAAAVAQWLKGAP
jgi:hypothetical protein